MVNDTGIAEGMLGMFQDAAREVEGHIRMGCTSGGTLNDSVECACGTTWHSTYIVSAAMNKMAIRNMCSVLIALLLTPTGCRCRPGSGEAALELWSQALIMI